MSQREKCPGCGKTIVFLVESGELLHPDPVCPAFKRAMRKMGVAPPDMVTMNPLTGKVEPAKKS